MHYVLLLLLWGVTCRAQFVRVPLSTQAQLPVPMGSSVAFDDEGYLWIGTLDGLFRSDGYHVQPFRWGDARTPVLHDNTIVCMADDHQGHFWVTTANGLYCIDKHEGYAMRWLDFEDNGGRTTALYIAADGSVWVAIGSRLLHFDASGQKRGLIECTWPGDGQKWVCDMAPCPDGGFYLAQCRGALCRVDDKGGVEECCTPMFEPQSLAWDEAHHGLWIGSWGGGVMWWDGHKLVTASVPSGYNAAQVIDVCLSADGRMLWATTMQGLEAYDIVEAGVLRPVDLGGLRFATGDRQILGNVAVDARTTDMWVAGFEPGTFAVKYDADGDGGERLCPDIEMKSAAYSAPYLYTWNNRQGLTVANGNGVIPLAQSAVRTLVSEIMAAGGDGVCYSCCKVDNGDSTVLSRLYVDGGAVRAEALCSVRGDVTALYHDAATQSLWVATHECIWHAMVAVQSPHIVATHQLPEGGKVNSMTMCRGKLYIGTSQGLLVANASGTGTQQLGAWPIASMTTQADSCVWAGTMHGDVVRLGADGIPRLVPQAAMPHGCGIQHIAVDSVGHVWTQSYRDVCEYSPDDMRQCVLGTSHRLVSMTYINTLCNMGRHIMVGGVGGAPRLLPSLIAGHDYAQLPRPRVSMVQADSTVVLLSPNDSCITVPSGTASVIIHLTTLCHSDAAAVTFSYRLRRTDSWLGTAKDNWTTLSTGQNLVYLSALPYGQWVVEAKATDSEGRWSGVAQVITIDCLPAWWQTWWANLLMVAFIVVCTMGGLRLWRSMNHLRRLYHKATEHKQRVYLQSVEAAVPDALDDDRLFMQRAVAMVEQHIADAGYAVESLASDLCMSRMTLYRRLNQLAGQTPSDFIRTIRLKYAARMLQAHPDMSVTDVASSTGFASLVAFRRQFKAMFGVTPSEYR